MPRQPCSRWRTDCALMRPTSGVACQVACQVAWLRDVDIGCPLCSARVAGTPKVSATCWPLLRTAAVCTATPNSCSLPHLNTGLEHLQHRSTPDSTCTKPCLLWCWQGLADRQTGHCLSRHPRSARPRPSNRCQVPRPVFEPPVRALVHPLAQNSTTLTITAQ